MRGEVSSCEQLSTDGGMDCLDGCGPTMADDNKWQTEAGSSCPEIPATSFSHPPSRHTRKTDSDDISAGASKNMDTRKRIHAKRTIRRQNSGDVARSSQQNLAARENEMNSLTTNCSYSITRNSTTSDDSAIWTMSNRSTVETDVLESIGQEDKCSMSPREDTVGTIQYSGSQPSLDTVGPRTIVDKNISLEDPPIEKLTLSDSSPTQDTQGTKRSCSAERSDNSIELSQSLAKLQLKSQSRKKKSTRKSPAEKELHLRLQHSLERMPAEKITELLCTQDDDGDNVLMLAIIENCTPVAKTLIRRASSPELLDVRNNLGQTILHLTVITRQRKLAREIILAGGNLLSMDFIGNTPLHVACNNNDLDSVVTLTKTVTSLECESPTKRKSLVVPQPSEVFNNKGQTCLHIAARNGYTNLVRYLVETRFQADVNAPERLCGKTVLHIAAEQGNLDLVNYLLSREETNRHALTYARHSALDLALGRGQQTVAKVLQRTGVKPGHNDTDEDEEESTDEEEEREEKRKEEESLWSLEDFQCSVVGKRSAFPQEPLEYDDLRVGGKLVSSFHGFMD